MHYLLHYGKTSINQSSFPTMRSRNTYHNAQNQNSNFTSSHHNIVLNMANKEYKESLENLEKFKHNVEKFKNYLTAYESFYQNLAKPYFLRISHDKKARKIQYKGLKLADMQFIGKNLSVDGWQKMEDHTKIGYMFISAHNWLVHVYGLIYENQEDACSQVSLHSTFAKNRKLQDEVIQWGDDINEKRKVLTAFLNELTSEDDFGNKRVQFEFLSGATDFVEKTYIEKWGIYTFRKDGNRYLERETKLWADLLLSKVLRWEKSSTGYWSIPPMNTNLNTKRASFKNTQSSTENSKPTSNSTIISMQRKKFVIESDSEDDPKNTSSAEIISPSSADKVGESTALSGLEWSNKILLSYNRYLLRTTPAMSKWILETTLPIPNLMISSHHLHSLG